MNRAKAILLAVLLAGCGSNDVAPHQMAQAVKACEPYGGLATLNVDYMNGADNMLHIHALCRDKTRLDLRSTRVWGQ